MPAPHERKIYIEDAAYHVFSRGINKAVIFHSADDYQYFTECMFMYLIPKDQLIDYLIKHAYPPRKVLRLASKAKNLKNYSNEIKLIAYCLMPNHFHLLIQQSNASSMTNFLKSLLTRYSMYYSRKYRHIGPIFQGRYKAIHVSNESYFNIVIDYIHRNPSDIFQYKEEVSKYPWSSASDYMTARTRSWVQKARPF